MKARIMKSVRKGRHQGMIWTFIPIFLFFPYYIQSGPFDKYKNIQNLKDSIPGGSSLLKNKGSSSSDSSSSGNGSTQSDSGEQQNNKSSSFENNLEFIVEKNRSRYEGSRMEFEPGNWVAADTKTLSKDIVNSLNNKKTNYTYEFELQGKTIATHKFSKVADLSRNYFKISIIPDPDSTEDKVFRWDWSGNFANALSKLPAGKHEITIKGYAETSDVKKMQFFQGVLTYNNTAGNGKMAQYAKGIDKNATFDQAADNAKFSAAHPGSNDFEDFRMAVVNDCGVTVTIKFANKKGSDWTHTLYPWGTQTITVTDMETIWLKKPGKNFDSGPSVSTSDTGKTVKLCH